ncbi:MAG TPA: lasso RiPP family leader peptide-containing protein [Longimicrobiaceae bacterium]|nr:lasso RiPP family leader peptide-containing protein [Longimicrobiaceae bacterium]
MEQNSQTQKKAYAPPTVTRHGEVVEKTLGYTYGSGELRNPGGPPHEN